jgi:hypothetical protein
VCVCLKYFFCHVTLKFNVWKEKDGLSVFFSIPQTTSRLKASRTSQLTGRLAMKSWLYKKLLFPWEVSRDGCDGAGEIRAEPSEKGPERQNTEPLPHGTHPFTFSDVELMAEDSSVTGRQLKPHSRLERQELGPLAWSWWEQCASLRGCGCPELRRGFSSEMTRRIQLSSTSEMRWGQE